jgi:hypothetical protein
MAFQHDDLCVSHQFVIGDGFPTTVLGVGDAKVRGSAFIEGPAVFGNATTFPGVWATVMIGPNSNIDSAPTFIPGALCSGVHNPYSLAVQGPSAFMETVDAAQSIYAGGDIMAQGEVISRCGLHWLSAKKNFDIPHPSKEGWRLRHTCPEGPSNDVYVRGRVTNKTEIELPEYWKDLVDTASITVNLTPIGSHQNVIIKRIDESKVYLQSNGGMPIDCFYHIFAERKDGEKLIPEYEGQTPADYPGNNEEYSVSGYHYDIKEK